MSSLDLGRKLPVPLLCFSGGLAAGLIMNKFAPKTVGPGEPQKWIKVGEISQLIIYPVKSLPGVTVEKGIVTPLGLQAVDEPNLRDRTFLVTNAKGAGQTQRVLPAMALIYPTVTADTLHLRFIGNETVQEDEIDVEIPSPKGDDKQRDRKLVSIFGDKVYAIDCGDEIGSWLDKVTGSKGLRLFHHEGDKGQRKLQGYQRVFPSFAQTDMGAFHDETSYMLMTQESIAHLNSKLPRELSWKSFRPTLIMKGSPEPWAEDFWSFLRIGGDGDKSPIFKGSRPCSRCKMTTIDPATGKTSDDGEPLKTLKSLKRQVGDAFLTDLVKNDAIMGAHFGVLKNEGAVISVGDFVYAAVL